MHRLAHQLWFLVTAWLLLRGAIGALPAQAASRPASPLLPSIHWSIPVARRLAALGLAHRDFGSGDGSLTIAAVGRVLHDAAGLARQKHPNLEPLATGYWLRFATEFPATAAALAPRGRNQGLHAQGWLSLGYSAARGRVYPVRSLDNSRENIAGPFPRPSLSELDSRANLSLSLGSHFAASLAPERRERAWAIHEGYALASVGKLGVWGGHRAPAFTTGAGGGMIFNGTAAFTGGGIVLTEPMRLPWLLSHLGAIRFESFLSGIDSNASVRRPWVLGSRGSISPHPRLLLGATQTFMFGGEGIGPFTWRNFKEMFNSHAVTVNGSEFENGLASVDVRFRPPVPGLPLTLYLEWGADDNHSAWVLFPGIISGAYVAAVPRIPALSLGAERTYFAGPCRPNEPNCHREYYSTWYRHYLFKDGWTLDRQPIGHPLGGEGTEWLLYGAWDDPAAPLRLDWRAFHRQRGPYNIYAPTREGRSVGGSLSLAYRTAPGADFFLTGALEHGSASWTESSLLAGLRRTF